jgi:probable HAF family extracellular repeat protein
MKILVLAVVVAAAAATGVSPAAAAVAPSGTTVMGIDIDPGHSSSWVAGINDANQVVGNHNVGYETHGFVWRAGVVTDLGTLPGRDYSSTSAINRNGDIVGASGTYSGPVNIIHAVVWHGGTIRDLGTLGGVSVASAINNCGVIVGTSQLGPDSAQYRAVMWRQGVMKVLPTLPGSRYDVPTLLDDAGDAAGYSLDLDHSDLSEAVLWANGTIVDLGLGSAVALNELGQVLVATTDDQWHLHAFIWDHGRKTMLPANVLSIAAMNDRGQVVGTYLPAGTAQEHGFLWQNGALTDLGDLYPRALNDRGQIIGGSLTTYGAALAWDHGKVIQLLSNHGAIGQLTLMLNDNGLAIGDADGNTAVAWQLP